MPEGKTVTVEKTITDCNKYMMAANFAMQQVHFNCLATPAGIALVSGLNAVYTLVFYLFHKRSLLISKKDIYILCK